MIVRVTLLPKRTLWKLLALVVPALSALATSTAVAEPVSTLDGVFNETQATRGAVLTEKYCSACHDQSYFTGVFLRSWSGQPAQGLYDLIRATMPRDRPGALKERQYADVLAYILSINNLPAGENKLDYKNGQLAELVIELGQTPSDPEQTLLRNPS